MCRPDTVQAKRSASSASLAKDADAGKMTSASHSSSSSGQGSSLSASTKRPFQVLVSLDSFHGEEMEHAPSFSSMMVTGTLFIGLLVASEMLCRFLLFEYRHIHSILENETNRYILARHLGVDTLSCLVCSILGWRVRHTCKEVFQSMSSLFMVRKKAGGDEKTNQVVPTAGYGSRLYTYHPSVFRLALFFMFYQVKNLYDTIMWNDGPEFVFHHVFSIITAWGVMYPGFGHYYAVFFFGVSEISTAVLCVLANFDDVHGVPGLGDALPTAKVAVGAAFVVLFLICRCTLWPVFAYYLCRDIMQAFRTVRTPNGDGTSRDPQTTKRLPWLYFFLISMSGISILQVAWLGQIVIIAKEELAKVGML